MEFYLYPVILLAGGCLLIFVINCGVLIWSKITTKSEIEQQQQQQLQQQQQQQQLQFYQTNPFCNFLWPQPNQQQLLIQQDPPIYTVSAEMNNYLQFNTNQNDTLSSIDLPPSYESVVNSSDQLQIRA